MAHGATLKNDTASRIHDATGVSVDACYQCGKCTAGCPVASEMDYPPSRLLRMLQIRLPEMEEKVLSSNGIWLCLACETCISRCPQEVDIPKLIDWLKTESLARKSENSESRDIIRFHRSFLDSIRYTGRLYEIGLVADYKLRSGHFLQDVLMAPKLFFKGKLGVLPHGIKDRRGISRIFSHTLKMKNKESRS